MDEPVTGADLRAAEALERALLNPERAAEAETGDPALAALLAITRRLEGVSSNLQPPSAALVRRIQRLDADSATSPTWWRRPRWAGLGTALALLLVAVLTLTVPGQAAFASLMAGLNLGQVQVSVTPDKSPTGPQYEGTRRATLASLNEARALVDYRLFVPATLPADYTLHRLSAVSYDGMPDWFPQPLYIEFDYRRPAGDTATFDLTVRQFGVVLGDGGRIKTLRFDSLDVTATTEVEVAGHPALLLTLGQAADRPLRELVWQQDDVMIELLSETLTPAEMLQVAGSLH